jgi:hypothetical protein
MAREAYSLRTCIHYRNTVAPCAAGVDPRSVTDADGRLPCAVIRNITGSIACAKLEFPTVANQVSGPMTQTLESIFEGNCPTCGTRIAGEMEFNEVFLALPCRHVLRSVKP